MTIFEAERNTEQLLNIGLHLFQTNAQAWAVLNTGFSGLSLG